MGGWVQWLSKRYVKPVLLLPTYSTVYVQLRWTVVQYCTFAQLGKVSAAANIFHSSLLASSYRAAPPPICTSDKITQNWNKFFPQQSYKCSTTYSNSFKYLILVGIYCNNCPDNLILQDKIPSDSEYCLMLEIKTCTHIPVLAPAWIDTCTSRKLYYFV